MSPKRRFLSCEICGDRASRKNFQKRKFMAKFPLDEARCKEWVKVVGNEDLIYVPIEKLHTLKYVCGTHFDNRCFNRKKNRLKKSAILSKNLKAPLPDELLLEFPCRIHSCDNVTIEASVSQAEAIPGPSNLDTTMKQSELFMLGQRLSLESSDKEITISKKRKRSPSPEPCTLGQSQLLDHDYCTKKEKAHQPNKTKVPVGSDLEVSPRKKKLIKKIHVYKDKINVLREANIMPRIKSLALKTLIKAYLRNQGRKPQGKRWTSLEKALAIALDKKYIIYLKDGHLFKISRLACNRK